MDDTDAAAAEPNWAMQLIARVERHDPPSHTAVCEAAATAVARLLADPRRTTDPTWQHPIDQWLDGLYRKHVRRARGTRWQQVPQLPGVTVEHRGAQLRALVPTTLDAMPPEVAKLQLAGRDLDDPDERPHLDPQPGLLVVSIAPDPPLSWPKAAAAAGHCAQLAQDTMPPEALEAWAAAGFPAAVDHPDIWAWEERLTAGGVHVVDAGLTEVSSGTTTAVAQWTSPA